MIAGLLLAAGFGRRFGGEKLMADLNGKPVVQWALEALRAETDVVVGVVPPRAGAMRDLLSRPGVDLVENIAREEGMASSIRAGVHALPDEVDAVLIALGDQPFVSRAVIAALIETFRATGADAVAPAYRDGRGHPVLFARSCFEALQHITGDTGARRVLDQLGARCTLLTVDADAPLDIDVPATLQSLARPRAS